MIRTRTIATLAALGAMTAAITLLAGLTSAKADELADLRANQQLLEQRLDQLSQAAAAAPGPAIGVGSFPRSFLIPGTDTSLRVGGQAVGSLLWEFKGAPVGGELNGTAGLNNIYTEGIGGTNLGSIPLLQPGIVGIGTLSPVGCVTAPSGAAVCPGQATSNLVGYAPPRQQAILFSGRQSQLYVDVRQPSPYGEVKAFVSMDFLASNTNTILNNNDGVSNGYIPRLREGYATIGGFLIGQTNGTMRDTDSEPETVDGGGQTGIPGIVRLGQIRYTYPLPNGMSVAVAAENPDPQAAGQFGQFDYDTNAIPNLTNCPSAAAGGATNNITVSCLGNQAFFDPLSVIMPNLVARWRIDQPWGHLQVGVQAQGYGMQDGRYLNADYIGYGGSVSGHFFTWGKDNLGFGLAGGNGLGDGLVNGIGLATNFGAPLAGDTVNAATSTSKFNGNALARSIYDSAVISTTIVEASARIYYQHWWTDQLRSTIDFSVSRNEVPDLPGYVYCRTTAGSCGGINRELDVSHLNLIWSPVAFVDVGVEGAWGHRLVVSNLRGDAYSVQGEFKVRF